MASNQPISQSVAVRDPDNTAHALKVNADGSINTVAGSGTTAAQVQGNVASGVADSGNPVKVGGVFNTTPATIATGQRADVQLTPRGSLRSALVLNQTAGADGVSNSVLGTSFFETGNTVGLYSGVYPSYFNGTTWDRQRIPNSTSRVVSSAASTNATSGKATTGWLFGVVAYNTNAAVRYLKIYNKASAPTVGTDTPVMTIPLPPTSYVQIPYDAPFYFSLGIAYALTTGSADNDTGAVGAADIVGLNLNYS